MNKNKYKEEKLKWYYALLCSGAFLVTACGGNGGVDGYQVPVPGAVTIIEQPATPTTPETPREEVKKRPVVGEGGDVLKASDRKPEPGEFLLPTLGKNYEKKYSPTVYYTSEKQDVAFQIEEARGGALFTALRSVTHDSNGKLSNIHMGNYVNADIPQFNHKLTDKLQHITTYEEAKKQSLYDAGLKIGGQYAGSYAAIGEDISYPYFWRDPAVANWNYQTYGMFDSGNRFINIGTVNVYQSIGEYTQTVPTGGEATYNGISSGLGMTNGHSYATTADVQIKIDFEKRTAAFNTTNTKKYDFDEAGKLKDGVAAENLNLIANAAIEKGAAGFTGEVKSADDKLSGKVHALLYGPAADEVGGVYGLKGESGTDHLIGGFGSRRIAETE
ncbi:transferrin-binding protein-like solute binding protein [Testudinibacter sp. P80/BLE/0925]|uniref:transferrin-binding protein-like solute binding protein n=1 Tax=Testudinibacter sp. TW-1 TaxID=3417757 RepID=UPI003D36FF84